MGNIENNTPAVIEDISRGYANNFRNGKVIAIPIDTCKDRDYWILSILKLFPNENTRKKQYLQVLRSFLDILGTK